MIDRAAALAAEHTEAVVRAAPDGNTVVLSPSGALVISPWLYKDLGYDPIKSFTHIAYIGSVPNVFVVNPSVPAKTMQELVAWIKAQTKPVNYGSGGVGSIGHIVGEMAKAAMKIQMTHVPYRGGGPLMNDAVAGHVPVAISSIFLAKPHIDSQRLRPLAVTTSQRSANLPGVPTVAESGFAGFDAPAWWAVLAPAKTPADIVKRMNELMLSMSLAGN